MSDFVGRMAARAVGISVVAQPRIPGVFEQEATIEPAAIAVIDTEVIAPRLSPREPAALVPATPPPDASVAREPASQPPDEGTASAIEGLAAPSPAEGVRPSDAVPEHGEHEHEHADPPQPHARPRTQPDEPTPAPAVAARPAPPAVPALALAAPSASSPPAAAPQAEPPAVRVHIGRLEVRANVQEPPRAPRRREVARTEGLSLSDYLRGKRAGA